MNVTPTTFAVIQTDDATSDSVAVARLMAEPLDATVADVVARTAQTRGILVEGLSEAQAQRCADSLAKGGIAVRVVAGAALIDPPPPCVLREARLHDDALRFVTIRQEGGVVKGSADWPQFFWLDFVSIQKLGEEEFEDWGIETEGRGGSRVVRFKNKRAKVERPRQIDLVSYEPWLWLQIREENLRFAATGLAMKPNQRDNMNSLAIALGLRASAACLGPGMRWFIDRIPPRESRMPNAAVHYSHLRWQLTRLWLDSGRQCTETASGH